MRAITVRQPWAFAIAALGKDVENRTRNIVGAYRGPVAIHAAKGTGTLDEYFAASGAIRAVSGAFPIHHGPSQLGAVIAVADIDDVLPPSYYDEAESNDAWCSPWAMPGHFQIVLANVQMLERTIPARGALGLWTLPPAEDAAVLAELARAAA